MTKGADLAVEFRLTDENFRDGTIFRREDKWSTSCGTCYGDGVYHNRQCGTCGGRGFKTIGKPTIEIKIPPGSRPGQKLRVRGYGWIPHSDRETRGDLIVTLRLFGDGEIVDELAAAPAQVLPPARARALPAGATALPGARVT